MTIARYTRRSPVLSPWRELEDMTDRLNRLFIDPTNGEAGPRAVWTPAVNVEENNDGLMLTAELPGMKADDIEIEVENNVLTLRGEKREEKETGEDRRYHVWERCYGSFQRVFTLPRTVKADEISARFQDGILHLHIPKAPEAQPKKIVIKTEG